MWKEVCQLRYSNQSFLGRLDMSGNLPLDNKKNILNPYEFMSIVNRTVNGLIKQAAYNHSLNRYKTGKATFEQSFVDTKAHITKTIIELIT